MKLKRSTVIPVILLIYLAVMAYMGWDKVATGQMSQFEYFGIVGITFVCIVFLHFNLKRREALRRARKELSQKDIGTDAEHHHSEDLRQDDDAHTDK
ncbi:MAG: hypothetical protein Q4F07_03495 [Bacteroidales bacterium]|nr:hypothetical protein [Bacteroidales bacterium]